MFTAALFIISKIWKQTNYPSIDERIKRCDTYIAEILFSHKKDRNFVMCRNRDGVYYD